MSGYKSFAAGERLFAADVNDFLMEQSVMTFADDAARTTALAGVLREGILTYNEDTAQLEIYDGSAFVPAAPTPPPAGLVAVKSALFTGTKSTSVAAEGNVGITELAVTHAVAAASNRLLITVYIGSIATTDFANTTGIAVSDGTNFLAVGDAAGIRARVSTGGNPSVSGTQYDRIVSHLSFGFVHTPGDTTSRTYTVHLFNLGNSGYTLHLNRRGDDADEARVERTASSLIVQEVTV
jgi:hypothetical protein